MHTKQMQPFGKIYPYIIIHLFYILKQINYTKGIKSMLLISIINGSVTKIKNRSSTFVSLEKNIQAYIMPKILAFKEGKLYYTYLEEDRYIWIFQRVRFPKLITVVKVCHGFESFLVGLQIPEFMSRLQQQPCNYIWVTGVTMIKDQKTQKQTNLQLYQ